MIIDEKVYQKTEPEMEEQKNEAVREEDWSPAHIFKKIVCILLKDCIIALVLSVVLFKIIFNVTMVHSTSMNPTLYEGDTLLLDHLFYEPEYHDIVVFKNEEKGILVKRIIGMPGDTIEIRDSVVYRNGEPLEEDYIYDGSFGPGDMTGPVTVEEGHVFVMGDNRPDSYDSRYNGIGQVSEDLILGGVLFRVHPFSTLK